MKVKCVLLIRIEKRIGLWSEFYGRLDRGLLFFKMVVLNDCFVFFFMFLLLMCVSKLVNISKMIYIDEKNMMKLKKFLKLFEDYIKGVKFEWDGYVNKDYYYEVFFGKMVVEGVLLFDNMEGYWWFIEFFYKVDKDDDYKVSKVELMVWIYEKIKEYIDEVRSKNYDLFKEVDLDCDGFVLWKEF